MRHRQVICAARNSYFNLAQQCDALFRFTAVCIASKNRCRAGPGLQFVETSAFFAERYGG
jgi:hypothetical protein